MNTVDAITPARAATLMQRCAIGGCMLLAGIVVVWIFASASSWIARSILLALGLAPLLLPLRGLLKGERRAYAGATLCAIPYLVYGITEAVATPQARFWPAACLAVAFCWFISLIAALRTTRPAI